MSEAKTLPTFCHRCDQALWLPVDYVRSVIDGKPSTTFWLRDEDDDTTPGPISMAGWAIDRPGAPCSCGGIQLLVGKRRSFEAVK